MLTALTAASKPRQGAAGRTVFYESHWPILLWLLSGMILLTSALVTPLTRTQEARVLVTAREMPGAGLDGWLIPHANGEIRLQKPPLAYWLSAISFQAFGTHELAGRVPMVLLAWLTIALTHHLAKRLYSPRAAFYAAAGLAGSLLFCRYARHAETDGPSMFFVTLAIYAKWRSWELSGASQPAGTGWLHLSAIAIGLAVLAKGPPAVFPLLFLLAFSWTTRRWDLFTRFFTRGAILTFLLVAVPWFLYVRASASWQVIREELVGLARGKGHTEGPHYHFLVLLIATLPWTPYVIAALALAVRQWRVDYRQRGLLLWVLCILLPLSLPSQKQDHYLLPILPPVFILLGSIIDRILAGCDPPLTRAARLILQGGICAGLIACVAPLIVGRIGRGFITSQDLLLALVTLALMLWPIISFYRRGLEPAFIGAAGGGAILMGLFVGIWASTVSPDSYRPAAREIQARFGTDHLAFLEHPNLSLCWELRGIFPVYRTPADAAIAIQTDPRTVLLVEQRDSNPLPDLQGATLLHRIELEEKHLDFYGQAAPTLTNSRPTVSDQ